jgi:glycosyltransferase involved in cell wall biosynthesis
MVSGDRQVVLGERGPFYSMQAEFSRYFERVDVICPKPAGEIKVRRIHDNVYFHPAPVTRRGMVNYITRQGTELIEKHGHALITSHDYGWFYNGVGSAHLSRRFKLPYLSELHHVPGVPVSANLREHFDRFVARTYVRWARDRAVAFRVVNSEEMPRILKRWGVPERKILFLPSLYIDHEIFFPAPVGSTPDFKYDVIFVGRMVLNKGLGRIVDALSLLKRRGHSMRALFVGRGPMRSVIEARAALRDLDATFIDWVDSPAALADLYRASRACICGSTCEGGPRYTVEAMACGTPAVSTPVGVMSGLVEDGLAGGLAGWDPHAMALALERVLVDEDVRLEMGRRAVERVRPFEFRATLALYANGLRRLAGEPEVQL